MKEIEALPHDTELEKAVLKCMLFDSICDIVLERVEVKDFLIKEHQSALFAIIKLREQNKTVDQLTLTIQLTELYRGERLTWKSFVDLLYNYQINQDNYLDYVDKLKQIRVRRDLAYAGMQLISRSQDSTKSTNEIVAGLSPYIELVREVAGSKVKLYSEEDYFKLRMRILQDRQERVPVMSGYDNLDRLLVEGFARKSTSVLAARPSMGKSATKSNLIKALATKGHSVVSVATEQSAETETDRLDALVTGIPLTDIINSRRWAADDYKVQKIKEANRLIASWPYYLLPCRGLTLAAMASELRKLTTKRLIDLVVIDLFDKIKDVNVALNKAQSVGVHLGVINELAEEFNCHFMLLVQVQRRVEERRDHKPKMSDIKDSGSYEEVARLILTAYRERYYNPNIVHNNIEICVAKQNNGPAGSDAIALFDLKQDTLELEPIEIGGRSFN